MTRPDDIPADVMETARKVLDGYLRTPISPDEAIARAILAERQRCISKLDAERVLPLYADPSTATECDIAYDMAIDHGIDAIRD